MTKSFINSKTPAFGPFSQVFWAKKNFSENPTLSCTTSSGFLEPCQNLEKTNDTMLRKRLD